ncbi:MAG: beta-lactamase family protein, partial [Saprospiraceae bacterium]|nr:beta-lactamase family protein [Saprospiraceae bacterium]
MKAKKIAFPFFLTALFLGQLVFYCGCSNSAANTDSTPVAPAPAVDAKLKLLIENYRSFFIQTMQETQTPGAAVAIVKGDSVIFLEGFGVRDTKSQTPVDVHTVFRIGSLSKGFAGILTGILVQDGMMEWNQTVQDCYPGFVLRDEKQASRMQIRHLLSHTTGLPYHAFTNLIEMGYDTRRIVENYFPRAPLSGREGEVFSYQNAAFCVIEPVMEASAHQTYDELLSGRIFKPAHMVDASCNFQSMQQSENKCLPHFWTGNYFNPEPISNLYYNSAAAGGVN